MLETSEYISGRVFADDSTGEYSCGIVAPDYIFYSRRVRWNDRYYLYMHMAIMHINFVLRECLCFRCGTIVCRKYTRAISSVPSFACHLSSSWVCAGVLWFCVSVSEAPHHKVWFLHEGTNVCCDRDEFFVANHTIMIGTSLESFSLIGLAWMVACGCVWGAFFGVRQKEVFKRNESKPTQKSAR